MNPEIYYSTISYILLSTFSFCGHFSEMSQINPQNQNQTLTLPCNHFIHITTYSKAYQFMKDKLELYQLFNGKRFQYFKKCANINCKRHTGEPNANIVLLTEKGAQNLVNIMQSKKKNYPAQSGVVFKIHIDENMKQTLADKMKQERKQLLKYLLKNAD